MTTSTLAVEYVTAQKHLGKPEVWSKFLDKNTLYTERAKRRRSGEATEGETMYVVEREGRELRILESFDPPNFGSLLLHSLCCCCRGCLLFQGDGDGGRHERGGAKRG